MKHTFAKLKKWLNTSHFANKHCGNHETSTPSLITSSIISGFKKYACQKPLNNRLFVKHFISFASFATVAFLFTAVLTNCTYKSPATETPMPTDDSVAKSFFSTQKTHSKTGALYNQPRTFLCGWASERETGEIAELTSLHNVINTEHCNLVFEITEKKLIGKMINPSFPEDPSRWKVAITIPITNHYYIEAEKDSSGRDTQKIVKNSSRSHWSARPYMDLDLTGINMDHFWSASFSSKSSSTTLNVDKIEWDLANYFLGFSITVNHKGSDYNTYRFNLLGFEHNPQFKKTPFNDKNYKRMNVLHIVGEKVNGLYQILNAAHWDLSKTHELRLWGFPEEYVPVMEEVVADWNEAFEKIGAIEKGKKAFTINKEPVKHAFDLRYPTMAWVSDEKISSYSPLGVGMTLADVKNGEVKWGMVTIYGGMIERYMKSYTAGDSLNEQAPSNHSIAKALTSSMTKKNITAPSNIQKMAGLSEISLSYNHSQSIAQELNESLNKLSNKNKKNTSTGVVNSEAKLNADVIKKMFSEMIQVSQSKASQAQNQIEQLNIADILFSKQPADSTSPQQNAFNPASAIFCTGRTFSDVAASWRKEISASGKNENQILKHMIKELISHEFGHFLGLGHQFKENILPNKDQVPENIYNQLAAQATKEKGYTNYNSVMGYRDPRTEIADTQEIKPGPQDLLVLKYLYQQKYATYKKGDSDFTYFDVPAHGVIPETAPNNPELKTSYFPQCNDIEASLSIDPFCNRFDRGSDALSIIENYFSGLQDSLMQNLFAFTDAKNGNAEYAEYLLWYKSFQTLGRTRIFYDYMRLYFKNEIDMIRKDEQALLEFSSACVSGKTQNALLNKIFSEKPQLQQLCKANAFALNQIKNLVSKNLTDYTKKNIEDRYTPGGISGGDTDRDWTRFDGSWTEMSGLPLKTASLYALTTSVPWNDYNYMPIYNDPNYKFSYSSLYPKEFTEIIAANVKNNLKFVSLGQSEKTNMGASVLSMSWLLQFSNFNNNDAGLFPPQYIEKIRNQQKFDFSIVAIILKGRKKDNNPNYVDSFDGSVFDFNSNRETPLTNAYLLPGGQVIASASSMFLYPITRFMPYKDDEGYAYAYKLNFTRDPSDPLSDFSVKTDLKELHDRLINACVIGTDGNNNGLSKFFNSSEPAFKGFKMPVGLSLADEKKKEFLDSIEVAFQDYYKFESEDFKVKPKAETCRESLRGLGLIISSAAVMNGFWLPEVMDYIQK